MIEETIHYAIMECVADQLEEDLIDSVLSDDSTLAGAVTVGPLLDDPDYEALRSVPASCWLTPWKSEMRHVRLPLP